MKKKLIIVGTGLFPEAARCYFDELSDYEVKAFSCHQKYKNSDSIYGLPLVSIEDLPKTWDSIDAKYINTNPNPIMIIPTEILNREELIIFFFAKKTQNAEI